MHEDPQIPNFGDPARARASEEGMVLAIEPMVTAGRHNVRVGDDGWAIYSQDNSLAAHFEFTVAVTCGGPPDPHSVARERGPGRGLAAGLAAATMTRCAGGP
jgi:methionine aminopeptidase